MESNIEDNNKKDNKNENNNNSSKNSETNKKNINTITIVKETKEIIVKKPSQTEKTNNKKEKLTPFQQSHPEFKERKYSESIEGELDEYNFFNTPNGSFWDPDYVYFNRDGYDKHGGYYEKGEYIPGKGWDEDNNCYKDELNDEEEIISDYEQDDEENDGFDQVDINKIHDEEKLIKITDDIEKINEDPSIIIHQI